MKHHPDITVTVPDFVWILKGDVIDLVGHDGKRTLYRVAGVRNRVLTIRPLPWYRKLWAWAKRKVGK